MAETSDFLAEIGTEELPPGALRTLADAFAEAIRQGLEDAALSHATLSSFATPRRLAVLVEELALQQEDRTIERKGPPLNIAYDAKGKPTRAALAFAETNGVAVADLETVTTPKGDRLLYRGVEAGRATYDLLADIVSGALDRLPIPKRMRWGDSNSEFVRPVHWVVLLLGEDTIEATLLGTRAGRETFGHRFHAPGPFALQQPGDYVQILRDNYVLANMEERLELVRRQVEATAAELGATAVVDEGLLEEVTALVEWPVPLAGTFDEDFLALPPEVLVATLQHHQRYFPVIGDDGKLLPHFIALSNLESREPATVRAGNERVIRPRLADAAFFWSQDRKHRLADRVPKLEHVVFQARLGSLGDKSRRVAALAGHVAERLGFDRTPAERAGQLAKCDLLSEMVGEFPELQGTMGRYYAGHDGEPAAVGQALEQQYWPRFAGDRLPDTPSGQSLAIAEKLDTIVGIFGIGQKPKGTRDPFGLRRAALGILRILIERELDLDLVELIDRAAAQQPVEIDAAARDEIYDYIMERLRGYYSELLADTGPELFDAVSANRPPGPLDFHQRLLAVKEFMALDAAASLAAANKRIANILRQADGQLAGEPEAATLVEPAERKLHEHLAEVQRQVAPLLENRRYSEALQRLASLRAPVDTFFDDVLVMAEDPDLRRNRLALLGQLRRLFLHVADLSRLPAL